MSEPASHFRYGPVEVGLLRRQPGTPAELLARAWLGTRLGAAGSSLPLPRDGHGRPWLGLAGVDCNWSHSGEMLLVGLGRGVRVGIDIETSRPRPRALELARRFFHPVEADQLAGLPTGQRTAAFLRLWSAKEAVLKAHGRGLAFGLERLRLEGFDGSGTRLVEADAELGDLGDWTLVELPIEGAFATLAWRSGVDA